MGFAPKGGKGAQGVQVQKPWLKSHQAAWVKAPQAAWSTPQAAWVKAPQVANGKGKGKHTVPANFAVNPAKRYRGTVTNYWKFKGYGFITPDQEGVIPGADRVFVHWKDVSSSDRFPSMQQGAVVTFSMQKIDENGVSKLRAANVTGEQGEELSFQDDNDAKKTFVGGQHLRYTGRLKFFSPKNGFGYIDVDEGYDYGEFAVSKEVRVETAEMNCAGKHPARANDLQVEFGIWQTKKGAFKAYNVTGPGGTPLEGLN